MRADGAKVDWLAPTFVFGGFKIRRHPVAGIGVGVEVFLEAELDRQPNCIFAPPFGVAAQPVVGRLQAYLFGAEVDCAVNDHAAGVAIHALERRNAELMGDDANGIGTYLQE